MTEDELMNLVKVFGFTSEDTVNMTEDEYGSFSEEDYENEYRCSHGCYCEVAFTGMSYDVPFILLFRGEVL